MDFKKHAAKAYRKAASGDTGSPQPEPSGPKAEAKIPANESASTKGQGVDKPGMLKQPKLDARKAGQAPSKTEIAKFLLALGKEQAAQILKHLPEDAVEEVVQELSRIQVLDPKERQAVLAKFDYFFSSSGSQPKGGVDTARGFLVQAFGKEKGEALLRKSVPEQVQKHFDFLDAYESIQIHTLLKSESIALKTLVLAHLDPQKTAGLIKMFPKEEQVQLIKRLSKLEKLDRDVLLAVEDALKERIRKIGNPQEAEIDGKGVLAEILKNMDATSEANLIEYLEEADPILGQEIKERLFTIDTLLAIEDRNLQKVLQEVENSKLALIMKGKSEEIRRKILNNLSQSRTQIVVEEYQYMGPRLRSEIDEATKEFVRYLKSLEEKGVLLVRRDSDEYI